MSGVELEGLAIVAIEIVSNPTKMIWHCVSGG
jgi:hypothetical protein